MPLKQTTAEKAAACAKGDAIIDGIIEREKIDKKGLMLFCIISSGRAANVDTMETYLQSGGIDGVDIAWIVGSGEVESYKQYIKNGSRVVEGGKLCASRNLAIQLAKELQYEYCVQLSDDVNSVALLQLNPPTLANYGISTNEEWRPLAPIGAVVKAKKDLGPGERSVNQIASEIKVKVSLPAAARLAVALLKDAKAAVQNSEATEAYPRLAGANPTANAGFAVNLIPVGTDNFIVGDFLVIDTSATPRFDERLTLKEDYDFTCQHLLKYGCVLRINKLLCDWKHYNNSGGAVDVRRESNKDGPNSIEQFNIAWLQHKWPGAIRAGRNVNEVKLFWSKRSVDIGGTEPIKRPSAPTDENYIAPPAKKFKVDSQQQLMTSFFSKES